MKLADYIADFFARAGVGHAFVVAGGASLHLIHGVERTPGIRHICCHHEQAAAMAADAYARITGRPGLAMTSSGPGATNLLTGICGCYYDSVPAVFVTGQVATFRMAGDTGVRQIGFQETPIVEMCREVTKYATQVLDPADIRFELEKALHLATSGRPGPVVVDVPDNIQRAEIDPASLRPFHAVSPDSPSTLDPALACREIAERLARASRPVLIAGWGIHLAGCEAGFVALAEALGVPVALTWGTSDLLPDSHPLRIGTFGTHGTRYANFAVQNADLILSIGSRLDTKATGSPPSSFARGAWKAVVDIDSQELAKFERFGLITDLRVQCDAGVFVEEMSRLATPVDCGSWLMQVQDWKRRYGHATEPRFAGTLVDPYRLFDMMSEHIPEDAQVWSDTGSTIAWLMQAFRPRGGQRLWHDFNNTAMGWALPAAIASSLACPGKPAYCVVGDGSLMMNLQELATVVAYGLPLKIICLDNKGYSMIQQTQDQWLDGKYVASSATGGLRMPDLLDVARSFGLPAARLSANGDIAARLDELATCEGVRFLLVDIDPACRVSPQVKFGRPNEDPEPLLDRERFLAEMIVPPLDVSRSA